VAAAVTADRRVFDFSSSVSPSPSDDINAKRRQLELTAFSK
jgi:hypothetical protein